MSALQGFTVLELCEDVSGEYCGKLLADFGARVIKLERPGCGSPTRAMGPFAQCGDDPERSGLNAYLNTNKCSLALDVCSPDGAATLAQLLQHADVVIDDHRAGWLRDVGLHPERVGETHPELVLCSITAHGNTQPADRLHAQDLSVFHSSGWGYHTPSAAADSQPPLKGAGRFLPSYEAGLDAALCIVAALHDREDSALGRFIDISKQEVLASRADYVLAQMVAGDMNVSTSRTAYDLHGPANIFPCRDGYVYIWMSAPAHWDALRKLLGAPHWMSDFPDNWLERECTAERVAQCRHHITQWLQTQDKHDAAAAAQGLGLTMVAVNNASDLNASPQYQFREYFSAVEHPDQGRALYPTVPYKLSVTPACIDSPAPRLGQHTLHEMLQVIGQTTQSAVVVPGRATTGKRRGGPLQGVRVVELTKVWAGPYVGKLLAYLGAEVIRVESEGSIDVTRIYGVTDINNAPGFQAVNTQKLSVQIDMKTEAGVSLILDLLRESDLVIENLRPGAVRRLGLDYERVQAVNPAIVFVSMGMYGTQGPLSYQTGYAPCFAALGGLSALVGYEHQSPTGMNIRYADSTFGAMAAFGALVALLHCRRSGVGQFVDVSAVESMSSMIGDSLMHYALNGILPSSDGNSHSDMAPHGAYPCRDGEWISIAVASDDEWSALAGAMGRADSTTESRFARRSDRLAHAAELDQLVSDWTVNCDAAELAAQLQNFGIAATRSQSSIDMIADPHLWARGFYQQVSDCNGDAKTTVGAPWMMSRAAVVTDAAPRLGEHNAYVFGDILGLSREQQQQLAEAGVTR
jgi:crotonobetainyl-CoA:carnitine CoA-transferase CaiB-like acyl-CoA transferase